MHVDLIFYLQTIKQTHIFTAPKDHLRVQHEAPATFAPISFQAKRIKVEAWQRKVELVGGGRL
jgi:hypothetical protein